MGKKVIYIWFKKYDGILDGGGTENYRMYHLLQGLFGAANVDSFYIHEKDEKLTIWKRVGIFLNFLKYYHNGITADKIQRIVGISDKYDYIYLSTSLFGVIARELKRNNYKGKIITHFHNVESVYYAAIINQLNPIRPIVVKSARQNDMMSCAYSDKTIVLNKRDDDLLYKYYGRKADATIPITVPDVAGNVVPTITKTKKKPSCMFLGSNFGPNREGVLWFVNNVLHYVDIEFIIVGKDMDKLKEENKCLADIHVVGNAPSLSPFFEQADFMVLPIFSGSGMKVKTCESLMYGKNIIGTDEAFEGYYLDYDKVGGKCNTAEEFIDTIKNFSNNPICKYNTYSRKIYEERYSEASIKTTFAALFT